MNSRQKFSLILIAATTLLLSGCVTLIKGKTQKVEIVAPKNSACVLSNSRGQWQLKGPGIVKVARASSPLTVNCQQANHKHSNLVVKAKANKFLTAFTMAELIIIPGGILISAAEVASGAIFDYPKKIQIGE